MKLKDVEARIPYWYMNGQCVKLRSRPGRGKTTVISEAPAKLSARLNKNLGFVLINGPLLTPQDSIGYLVPKHLDDGRAESVYTDPFWFRTAEGKRLDEYEGGIILVDEDDKMDVDVKKVIGEAALSGRLGPHQLPPGWVVWMAGNYADDRSGGTKELDHLINRRREIDITDDLESLLDWQLTHGTLPVTQAFTSQHPEIVLQEKVPDKQGPWCTPRSLAASDKYIQDIMKISGTDELPDDPITQEEIAGQISAGSAMQYFAFVKLEREMPKYEKIVADPKGAKLPTKPDAQMLTAYHLAARVSAKDAGPVITYVERLPKEFSVTFAHAATKRDMGLVITPEFNKWALKNSSLMASMQALAGSGK